MRSGHAVETMRAGTASDQFFTGRLTIVDVRSHAEFDEARVPGATHIPFDELEQQLPELRSDRPLAFLCQTGKRSAWAAQDAAKRRPDVASIDGGMDAWIAAGLPTARCSPPPRSRKTT